MVQRYNITLGAKTTVGGVVATAHPYATVNDVPLAREGDFVNCPACQTQGRIKCAGLRISAIIDNKEFALSDDLCICNCDPPPQLIASQTHMFQTVDDSPSYMGWTTANQIAASTMPNGTHDLSFEVKDKAGIALAGYPYLIELPDGRRLEGITDRDGITRRVGAMSAENARLTVFAPEPGPVDPDWDR
jgi:uncharacterized Zn-binding protein involved in type VI secretion